MIAPVPVHCFSIIFIIVSTNSRFRGLEDYLLQNRIPASSTTTVSLARWFPYPRDKEPFFNVAFETNNLSSVELLLRHNRPTCFLLSSWHYPFFASVSKGAISTIFIAFCTSLAGHEHTTCCSRSGRSNH